MANPFVITKAEEFNHSYELLASLMEFKAGVADVLLSNTNVILEGSRGSGKSMYLRILSLPVKTTYETLAEQGHVEPLPEHSAFVGIYAKLNPTIFAANEYEGEPGFALAFQKLFNMYCVECLISTVLEAEDFTRLHLSQQDEILFREGVAEILLPSHDCPETLQALFANVRQVRREARQALDVIPFSPDVRSQPDVLWQCSEIVTRLTPFRGQRVHFLVDEYDSLSPYQQRIVNGYLRKRDFPTTFKIACKKHRLELRDLFEVPLNPSGDFARIELDDNDFGISSSYSEYASQIANKRLKREGFSCTVEVLLGRAPRKPREHAEIQYGGLETVVMLSSGIVRTFLELCRDIFSRCTIPDGEPVPATIDIQDTVIKQHATNKWLSLSRDQSARPELQHLIQQVGSIFRLKTETSVERQIIRLEIIDFDQVSTFLGKLLTQALEYEALVQPNRERLQKNRQAASRGYLLHRLLCVHFRLAPTSRWDTEVSAVQLERLVLGDYKTVVEVASSPTKTPSRPTGMLSLFDSRRCPILGEECPPEAPSAHVGFLSCRLPKRGHIRDAIRLLKETFESASTSVPGYELRTAEEFEAQGDIACKVCHAYAASHFVLVELSRLSPSVAMELGLAIGRGKPTYVLFNTDEQGTVPEPFSSLEYFQYEISPGSVRELVEERLVPQIEAGSDRRRTLLFGPEKPFMPGEMEGVFVSLPNDVYHQETVLPAIRLKLEEADLGPVVTEHEGQALQDLQRASMGIAKARYCLIDTTNGAPTRAMYLGLAQGYRKQFANLIDSERDSSSRVFTNARSKAEVEYSDVNDLLRKLAVFFENYGIEI